MYDAEEETTPPDKELKAVWAIMNRVGERYRRKTGRKLSLSRIVLDLKNGH